jgi:hypothetical protein
MRLKEFTNNTVANWKNIASRNNLANPDLIMPGQVLDIGDGVVMPKGTTYTVKPGDTLSGIAQNIRKGQVPDPASSTYTPALPTFRPPMPNKTSIPNKAPKLPADTGSYDGEFKKIRDIESGNRDYDSAGRPIVSPKGAKFAAQVLPATSSDPGFGVKPAANAGAEEFNRVGRDYFAAMKNKYGNSELAAAAYNAGPGRVDKILQKAKQTGQDWKTLLPRETQKYLDKFKGKQD